MLAYIAEFLGTMILIILGCGKNAGRKEAGTFTEKQQDFLASS